jgi:acyl-CoA reductase-like NAD-dependent aldehyde dehydrogenase
MEEPSADEESASAPAPAPAAASLERQLRHRLLAARTVAVSFRAAMESAERHLNVPADERAEIKRRWRTWAIETLEGYAAELETLTSSEPIGDANTEALQRYRDELERAFEMVRTTPDDG